MIKFWLSKIIAEIIEAVVVMIIIFIIGVIYFFIDKHRGDTE